MTFPNRASAVCPKYVAEVASPRTPAWRAGLRLCGAVSLLALVVSCASAPRPKVLDDASHLVNRSEAGELEALRPKLVKQARDYLTRAEDAYGRGDLEATGLYAYMAIQRFETASNYVARDSAQALAKVMNKARQEAAERQAELERFQTLEARIAALDADLLNAASKGSAEVNEAKSALFAARRKQATAIGAGAPTYAPEEYEEGRSLVETGVESLELAMYSDSIKTSNRAVAKLDEAIALARNKKKASVAGTAATSSKASSDLAKAQSVINDAASAQAFAIAQRAPEKNPALYQQGESLLRSAEQRLRDEDYGGAVRHAEDSIVAFRRAMTEGSAEVGDAGDAIHAAEDARSGAIARGASSEDLGGADFLLSTARRALEAGDSSRAKDKARQAREAYANVGGTQIVRAGPAAAAGSDSVSKLAEAKIIELRFQRAELLGQDIDQSCGGPYREFEAILQLAADRLEAGDGPRAYEFAIRAQERLRACDPSRPSAIAVKAGAANAEIARSKAAAEIRKAQQALAAARSRSPNDDRLQQPASLIDDAERWYTRKAYNEAQTLAKEASAVLMRLRTAPAPATKKTPKTGTDTAALAKTKAATAIQKAQEAHAKAAARNPDDVATKQAGLLIGAAERWFEQAVYDRAEGLANDALAELGKPAGPARKKSATVDRTESGAVCADARTQLREARQKDTAVKTAKLTPPQSKTQRDARALVRTADAKLKKGACAEAGALAYRAAGMLSELPGNEQKVTTVDTATKPSGARPATKASEADEKVTSRPPPAWKGAYDKITHALRLQDQARVSLVPEARPAYDRGERSLAESRAHYRAKRYSEAERSASVAIAQFETAISTSGLTPAAPVASAPVTTRRVEPEAMAQQVIQRYETQGTAPTDGAWKTAYRQVIAALAARDMAKKIAMEADQAEMARGQRHLDAARDAWSKKRYAAAGQDANEARAAFSAVASAASARAEAREAATQPEPIDAREKAKYREADQAIREASVTLKVCEREHCDDRDFAGLAEAQAMVESAQSSFTNKDYAYATQLATDAKDKLREVLAKPRKTKPPTPAVDAEHVAEQRRKAEEAAREAVVARKLCERSGCARADYEAWLRAEQLISASHASYADERFEEAEKYANAAGELLRRTLDEAPKFTIPEGISNVTLVDDQLVVVPPITFYTGSSTTKPESLSSLQNLAQVLRHNESALDRIEVIGFTDAQGDRAKNIQLSATRARSVLNTLARLGVPREKLTAEGRGPSNPVADNATAEGRERNRRVEVHVTLSENR